MALRVAPLAARQESTPVALIELGWNRVSLPLAPYGREAFLFVNSVEVEMIDPDLFGKLQKLCQRTFPDRLDQRLSRIERLQGERHPMLALTLSWRRGKHPGVERLVLRSYGDAWTWWSTDDPYKAQREWEMMRWLFAHGLPVPHLYALGRAQSDDSLLMAWVPGRSAASILDRDPSGGEGSEAQQAVIGALGELLAVLHQLTPGPSARERLPTITLPGELARLAELAHQYGDAGMVEAVHELRAQNVEVLPPCVLHGDPHLANVLCDARGITALLHWENSAYGDPRWDVARVTSWLRGREADLHRHFCEAYVAHGGILPTDLAFWEALVAVQQWVTATWVRAACGESPALADLPTWKEQAWRALTRLRQDVPSITA
jgi:aminoglycoside phosphotransferase (APT) family kinase protein